MGEPAKAWLVRYKDGTTDVTTEEWKVAMWRENGQEVVELVEAGAVPAEMPVDWDDIHSRLSRAMPRGIGSPHNACGYREQCKALEARALAAEAALAADRERCAKIAENPAHTLDWRARAAIAAAIRARGADTP